VRYQQLAAVAKRLGLGKTKRMWRPLLFAVLNVSLSFGCLAIGWPIIAWVPAVISAIWLAMAVYVAVTGRPSPL
jgi:hypothetical protein